MDQGWAFCAKTLCCGVGLFGMVRKLQGHQIGDGVALVCGDAHCNTCKLREAVDLGGVVGRDHRFRHFLQSFSRLQEIGIVESKLTRVRKHGGCAQARLVAHGAGADLDCIRVLAEQNQHLAQLDLGRVVLWQVDFDGAAKCGLAFWDTASKEEGLSEDVVQLGYAREELDGALEMGHGARDVDMHHAFAKQDMVLERLDGPNCPGSRRSAALVVGYFELNCALSVLGALAVHFRDIECIGNIPMPGRIQRIGIDCGLKVHKTLRNAPGLEQLVRARSVVACDAVRATFCCRCCIREKNKKYYRQENYDFRHDSR
eukprot:comp20501_c0_seq1/m.41418 comp20501_c0_seq1/g.41418  ORF comp20501_c0_seq1/g.41418 comp20501_c0_seq1/m.41418 type:complete len:315 (+) comp20501_c0_seq1:1027-1971(+)